MVPNKYILLLVALFAAHLIFAQESSSEQNENGTGDDPTQRFFFYQRYVSCNSTSQSGRSCLGCRTILVCGSNNVGVARVCKKFTPYCNQGYCSSVPGSACTG